MVSDLYKDRLWGEDDPEKDLCYPSEGLMKERLMSEINLMHVYAIWLSNESTEKFMDSLVDLEVDKLWEMYTYAYLKCSDDVRRDWFKPTYMLTSTIDDIDMYLPTRSRILKQALRYITMIVYERVQILPRRPDEPDQMMLELGYMVDHAQSDMIADKIVKIIMNRAESMNMCMPGCLVGAEGDFEQVVAGRVHDLPGY